MCVSVGAAPKNALSSRCPMDHQGIESSTMGERERSDAMESSATVARGGEDCHSAAHDEMHPRPSSV